MLMMFSSTSSLQSWKQHLKKPKSAAIEGRLNKTRDISPVPGLLHAIEMSPNEAASQLVPDMQYFGNKCHIRNTPNGYNVYAVDCKYLNEAISHLLEGNHEVLKIELQRKNDFSELVMNYFTYCASLEECLKKASKIHLALGKSEQKEKVRCLRRLQEELENFKEYYFMTSSEEISRKMQTLNKKINKRLKSAKRWRKALTITSDIVSVVVPFLGVATAIVVPPLATCLELANTILECILRWFDSFWKGKEKALKGKVNVIRSMELNHAGFQDLGTILDQIYKIGIEFESLFQNADLGEDDTMKNLGDFLKKIEDLCKQADMYSSYMRNARKGVLRSMIEDAPK